MVKGYSEGAWIWRVPRILEVVEGILAERDEPMVTLSLRRVSFWERGGRLEKVEKRESKLIEDEFVRLTVDANGLKRVERFPHRPSWIDESPQDEAFALVREQDLLGEVFAELKVRFYSLLLRLQTWCLADRFLRRMAECVLGLQTIESRFTGRVLFCGTPPFHPVGNSYARVRILGVSTAIIIIVHGLPFLRSSTASPFTTSAA